MNCGDKIPIEENKTLFLSNFFSTTRLTELSRMLEKFQLRKSLLVPPIQFRYQLHKIIILIDSSIFSSNSKFLIVRFETEAEAFLAYRDLDGLLIKDMHNGKLIKRLKATLY